VHRTHISYLYDNEHPDAGFRLKALEAIEDQNSISLLRKLADLEGLSCLEIGAGAGSIAEWMVSQVGQSGCVTATDIDPRHLSGSRLNVLRHDIEKDELPTDYYDLVHIRHVLIHTVEPLSALRSVYSSMKKGAVILVEESNLDTWEAQDPTPAELRNTFQCGVDAVRNFYESRGMDIRLGRNLRRLLRDAGFSIISCSEESRMVRGGSSEAQYQSTSANQLAASLDSDAGSAAAVGNLVACLLDPELRYKSRATVSVSAERNP